MKTLFMKLRRDYFLRFLGFLFFILMVIILVGSSTAQEPAKSLLRLESYPDSVTSISLKNQGLKTFPKELYRFKNLQFLDLSGNDLSEIPIEIKLFTQLQFIDVSQNRIKQLPPSFSSLVNLKSIYIGGNQSLDIDQAIDVMPAKNIETLDLQFDNISTLPINIGKFKNLKKLILTGNPIQKLPTTFSQLTNLQILFINKDPYFDIDQNIETLNKINALQELHLEEIILVISRKSC